MGNPAVSTFSNGLEILLFSLQVDREKVLFQKPLHVYSYMKSHLCIIMSFLGLDWVILKSMRTHSHTPKYTQLTLFSRRASPLA